MYVLNIEVRGEIRLQYPVSLELTAGILFRDTGGEPTYRTYGLRRIFTTYFLNCEMANNFCLAQQQY